MNITLYLTNKNIKKNLGIITTSIKQKEMLKTMNKVQMNTNNKRSASNHNHKTKNKTKEHQQ